MLSFSAPSDATSSKASTGPGTARRQPETAAFPAAKTRPRSPPNHNTLK